MPGSRPVDLNEEPDINANPPIAPPTSQGFQEVFSLFQTYLETRLEHSDKELEDKQRSRRPEGSQQGGTITEQTKSLLDKRQKPIKLTDLSEASWDAAQEYECEDIASNDEDDKKIRNARAATNRKRMQKERERQQQTSKKRCTTPSRGTADHHLSSGICIATAFTVHSFCYFLRCFVFFSCYIGSS